MVSKERRRILIVDDEKVIRETLAELFEMNDFVPTQARNGAEAYEIFSREPVDFILSDIRMPELDGVELLKKIRQSSQIPMILMTAYSDIDAQKIRDLGGNGLIKKPFDLDRLLEEIGPLLP